MRELSGAVKPAQRSDPTRIRAANPPSTNERRAARGDFRFVDIENPRNYTVNNRASKGCVTHSPLRSIALSITMPHLLPAASNGDPEFMKTTWTRTVFLFLLLAAVLGPEGSGASPLKLQYRLRITRPTTHLAEVEIRATDVNAPSLDFVMPAWAPGCLARTGLAASACSQGKSTNN